VINPSNTLLDVLHTAADGRPAVIVPEHGLHVSYDSLRRQVMEMARALAGAGIRRDDRVATALPNGLPAIVSFLAASLAGTAAPLNPAYRYDEFCFFLEDTSARILICPPNGAEEARRAAADRNVTVLTVEMDAQGAVHLLNAPAGAAVTEPSPDDVALILHTSGSTGHPKRVPLKQSNLAISAANIVQTYSLTADDVSLCVMPLFHVHGLMASTIATLLSGGTVVVPGKFEALSFWRMVREHRVSWYSGVPTIHQLLLARAGKKGKPAGTDSLRFIRSCSTPLSAEVMHKMEEVFRVPLVEAYGMTEAAHQMTSNPLPPLARKPSSVGSPVGVHIGIMDEDSNHFDETEQRGEIVIQGPSVFQGYENNPEANAGSFVDGWFRTGDEGFLDSDGYLHLTGRLKELINRAGEKIMPREVDKVLLAHPAVAEAVTFGYSHPTLGEEVAAAVVLHDPETEAVLLKHCRERLAEYKCPKKLYIVSSIPQTATGKVRRNAVAAALSGARA
jgi:acyl-CoA synthetase (AMP-forming)/AMP-acid ligase II